MAFSSVVAAVLGPVVGANGFTAEAECDDVSGFEGVTREWA
jgi:hypothetical protein